MAAKNKINNNKVLIIKIHVGTKKKLKGDIKSIIKSGKIGLIKNVFFHADFLLLLKSKLFI